MSGHALLTAQTVEDCIIDQGWERYSAEDHATWRVLFERQQQTLKGHVARNIWTASKPSASAPKACRILRR